MKRLLSLVVIVLAVKIAAVAQPTISFPTVSPCTDNPSFCMDATIDDFTDILSLEFTIAWNPEVIRFDRVSNFGLPSLSAANFDVTKAADGYITLKWSFAPCSPTAVGVTLPDNRSIFRLCFTALGAYGDTTTVRITNQPVDIKVTRVNACDGINIGLYTNPGVVSTCVRPLELIASNGSANSGDLVCIDFKVRGFDDMTSFQFSVNWDPAVLKYESIVLPNTLVNLSESGFGTPADPDISPGSLTVSWAYVDPNSSDGVTLPDSTTIFQVCFRIVGPCESSTAISFSSMPTPIEVTNTVKEGFELAVLSKSGNFKASNCNPRGLKLFANCGPEKNIGDEVCVQVTTEGFKNILRMNYLMEWNPNILRFKDIRLPNPIPLLGLGRNDFDDKNVVNGILGLDWETVANIVRDLPDGTVLYEVCFEVVGLGANSPIRFPTSPALVKTTTQANIGINPTNCEVRVIQPEGVTMTLSDGEGAPGDTVCVDVTVSNFKDILSMQFSLAWEPGHVNFLEVRDIALAGASAANFDTRGINNGSLVFDWDAAQAMTLADATRLFTLCYVITGTPKDCQSLIVTDDPLEAEVISASSNNNNIGLTGQGGEICVLNPEGYTLIIDEEEGFLNDTICVPFRVADFEGITATTFTVNWDPTALEFLNVNSTGALSLTPAQNFETGSADVGVLTFKYQNVNGATLNDSTAIFELCLKLKGPKNNCFDITLNPVPTVTTVNGEGSVQLNAGEICIKDRLIIEKINITPVSCTDGSDGVIELTVSGGTGQIFFNWASTPVQFTNRARNLPVGQVAVAIFDSNNPPLILRDTFEIPLTTNLPFADAGPDRVATCDPDIFLLEGKGNAGANFAYEWSTVGGTLPGDRNALRSVGSGAGQYILTVRNTQTLCAVSDTVDVTAPQVPLVNAGTDLTFDCSRDTLTLDGTGSAVADTIGYAWTASNGGKIVTGDESLRSPRITAPGTYVLETFFTTTGCSAKDTVVVSDARNFPDANGGDDVELGCTEDFVLLDGSGSVNEGGITYQWTDESGSVLANAVTYQATRAGRYVFKASNSANGCVAVDTVQVVPSGEFPVVSVGNDQTLTCRNDTLQLTGEISNAPNNSYQWVARNGGQIVTGTENSLTPRITAPGVYELVVTNTSNQCVSSDSLVVEENREFPMAEAGDGFTLTCTVDTFTLNGAGSTQGDLFSYTWTLNGSSLAVDTLQHTISEAGTYYLEVVNRENGCSAVDSVRIDLDENIPQLSLDTVPAISCTQTTATLTPTVTPANSNYTVQWATNDGTISGSTTALSIQATAPGVYTLSVTNPDNGCVTTQDFTVADDRDNPVASAGADRQRTCRDSVIVLDGSASASGTGITYQWSAVGGGTAPDNATSAQASTRAAGTYVLLVSNTSNGCSARDTVVVTDNTSLPQVSIATPGLLSCTQQSVTLDGTASQFGANFTATWSGAAGQPTPDPTNSLKATVGQAGTYELRIRNNDTGCEATATIEVKADASIPTANAGGDQILSCPGTPLTLNGSNSSSGQNITYQWTVVNGAGTIDNATGATATVTQPGTYQLEVSNTTNGCSATASVTVTLDPALVQADAGEDMSVCDNTGMLFAQAPAGATGAWTSAGGVKIESPSQASTFVEGLVNGDNVFTWTLSRPGCPNYSSDQVVIRKEVAPVANNDVVTLAAGQRELEINVVGNDQLNNSQQWNVTVMSQPNLGQTQLATAGRVKYLPRAGAFGIDEFSYQVCNLACPGLCDSAFVQVTLEFDEDYKPEFPNAITPNGDGVNDELVFDILENAVDFWPDNQLIIFNRWGDIVYQAKPYTNNWRGTTDSGLELPDGTYYYILRLDISNGVIYKGDITILK